MKIYKCPYCLGYYDEHTKKGKEHIKKCLKELKELRKQSRK